MDLVTFLDWHRLGIALLLFFMKITSTHASGTSLIIEVPDNQNYCFYEAFRGTSVGKRYIFQYKVIRGGNNDIDAWVISPNGKILYKEKKRHDGKFIFDTSRGDFRFCFGNEFSTITHKVVYFDLRDEEVQNLSAEAGDKIPTVKTSAETSCDNIHLEMTATVSHQKDYRLKEAMGRHVAEVMHQNVTWWSMGQSLIIVMVGFGQVLLLKTFFTEKRATRADA